MAITDVIRGLAAVFLLVAGGGLVFALISLHRLSHAARRQAEAIERIAGALARPAPEGRD
ncbi:MAG: hypothetical protein U0S76_11155 [Pseudoxanthomonas sp.]|nr:hypothetical protein [Pseudoxanthomonas sp.]